MSATGAVRRRRDVDELGHLNQAVYHELLEEGRAALFAPRARMTGSGSRWRASSSTTSGRCAWPTARLRWSPASPGSGGAASR